MHPVTDDNKTTGLRIAVASYDERFLHICQNFLTSLDISLRCDPYRTGAELLRVLESGLRCHALLSDITLADMDAGELCRRVLALQTVHRPKLLLIAAAGLSGFQLPGETDVHRLDLATVKHMLLDLRSIQRVRTIPSEVALRRQLAEWGARESPLNRDYMVEAVCFAMQGEERLAIRKDVLQQVSEQHQVSVKAVDSGIRRLLAELNQADLPAWRAFKARHPPPERQIHHQHLHLCRPRRTALPAPTGVGLQPPGRKFIRRRSRPR